MSVAIACVVLVSLVLQPSSSFHSGLAVVYSENVAGSGAFGVRIDQAGTGDLAIDLHTVGPSTGSQISVAAAMFDAARNLQFMFAFTGHTSPDRLVVSPAPIANVAPADWDGTTTSSGTPVDVTFTTSDTDGSCTFACMGLTLSGAGPGPHYFIVWAGAVSATELLVRGTLPTQVATVAGTAHVVGDPEIADGAPNVQVQETAAPGASAGLKVIKDATYGLNAAHGLWGFWGASDFKLACQFAVVGCIWGSTLTYQCSVLTGLDCNTARLSWDGPGGGGEGYTVYGILGGAPGAYSFTVDLKVDGYGPNHYDPATGTWVFLGEHYSYLSVADVALPA